MWVRVSCFGDVALEEKLDDFTTRHSPRGFATGTKHWHTWSRSYTGFKANSVRTSFTLHLPLITPLHWRVPAPSLTGSERSWFSAYLLTAGVLFLKNIGKYITKRKGHTGRILARGLDSTVWRKLVLLLENVKRKSRNRGLEKHRKLLARNSVIAWRINRVCSS